jgi:DNA-directed RNA polymerase III subunit RPC4
MQKSLLAEMDNSVSGLEQSGEAAIKDKEGRLYLFQFPPLLPPLVNNIKEDAEDGNGDMMQASATTSAAVPSIDLTQPDNELDVIVKAEEGLSIISPSKPELVMEEGFIGKLIVRRSGKVELDWGGTILKLGRGVESSFLTTTVIIDGPPQQSQEEEAGLGLQRQSNLMTGTGTGMGKVMGKFVATPDFSKMLEID